VQKLLAACSPCPQATRDFSLTAAVGKPAHLFVVQEDVVPRSSLIDTVDLRDVNPSNVPHDAVTLVECCASG